MKKIQLVIISAILSGCSVPTSGVIPRGNDIYTVTHQGEGFWVTTDQLKNAAIQEAQASCDAKGKKVNVIHTKEIQAGALGRWPESEVLFKCE